MSACVPWQPHSARGSHTQHKNTHTRTKHHPFTHTHTAQVNHIQHIATHMHGAIAIQTHAHTAQPATMQGAPANHTHAHIHAQSTVHTHTQMHIFMHASPTTLHSYTHRLCTFQAQTSQTHTHTLITSHTHTHTSQVSHTQHTLSSPPWAPEGTLYVALGTHGYLDTQSQLLKHIFLWGGSQMGHATTH